MTLVKVCGLMRAADVEAANAAGVDFAGFILSAGFRRSIEAPLAAELSAQLGCGVIPVGVFVDEPVEAIAAFVEAGVVRMVQLHGDESEAFIAALRRRLPETTIVKAFKVRSADDVAAANESSADVVLLDNGKGTGETFDWSMLAAASRPYMLAGGLGPDNVAKAIAQLHPYAVDMSSGVETNGVKDPEKIAAAVKAARNASAEAGRNDAERSNND